MPKRENYDKNNQSSDAQRKKSQAITQSPERKIAQLRYRLTTIDESVAAGRREYNDEVDAEVKRLRAELEALEAQNG
jgi:hypothetical protein